MHKSERKGGLSCAECRRSKLRCDRNIPCSACVRRNCASICPDGTLAATKGNKILQNQNQTLQEQVRTLSNRVAELEDTLAAAQGQGPSSRSLLPHRDLHHERDDDSMQDFEDNMQRAPAGLPANGVGSLRIGEQGQAKFHGLTAASEYLHELPPSERPQSYRLNENVHDLRLPWHIVELVNAFPFGEAMHPEMVKPMILQFLPVHQEALRLSLLYYEHLAWLFDPIPREDFNTNIMTVIYHNHPTKTAWELLHPHQLSVFFLIMAMGELFDDLDNDTSRSWEQNNGSPPQWRNIVAERYYALACASFALESITNATTVSTIQALFIKNFYLSLTERSCTERRWLVAGLTVRISESIGLQRDASAWGLSTEDIQRRRILFWELYTYDAWTSVVYGRPPALNIRFSDCRFPEDRDATVGPNGESEFGFHAWKYRISALCLSQAIQHVFSTKVPEYTALLELDHRLRRFPVPSSLQSPTAGNGEPVNGKAWANSPSKAMMQYCVLCTRESMLLYIHRSYLARAIKIDPANPLNNRYGASVMSAFRSASLLISGLRSLHGRHPKLTSQMWFFWSGVYSSCIVLGALVIESPSCSLSGEALQQLDHGVALFVMHCSPRCRPAGTTETLLKLQKRAHRVYTDQHAGETYSRFKQSSARDEERDTPPRCTSDELHVLSSGGGVISSGSSQSVRTTTPLSVPLSSRNSVSRSTSPGRLPPMSGPGTSDVRSTAAPAWGSTASGGGGSSSADLSSMLDPALTGGQGYDQGSISASTSGAYTSLDFGEFGSSSSFPSLSSASSSAVLSSGGGGVQQASIHPMLQDTDVAMDNVKPNEEAIWQNFLRDLGIAA